MSTLKEQLEETNNKVEKNTNDILTGRETIHDVRNLLQQIDTDQIDENKIDLVLIKERVALLIEAKSDHDRFITEANESVKVLQTQENFMLDKLCSLADTIKEIEKSSNTNEPNEPNETTKALIAFTNKMDEQLTSSAISEKKNWWLKVSQTVVSAIIIAILFYFFTLAVNGWYDDIRDGQSPPAITKPEKK